MTDLVFAHQEPMSDLETRRSDRRVVALTHVDDAVRVTWDDGRESGFDAIWLRDNCACAACRHPVALERQFLFLDAPLPIRVEHAALSATGALEVRFGAAQPEGAHISRFDPGWLYDHSYADWGRNKNSANRVLWDGSFSPRIPKFDHRAVMEDDAALRRWLEALRDVGVTLVQNAPPTRGEVQRIAERVGSVRETNFGRVYDVESKPNPNASAYTPIGLEPHTDLANVAYPPDYQLLFCIANEAEGGGSVLVDGFRVAEELSRVDADAFALLANEPIEFRFHDESCDLRHRSPVLELDRDGSILRIRFNNWLRSAPDVPEPLMVDYYQALGRFWALLRDRRFQLRPMLEAGEMLAFDNRRVLHGRDPFDPATGRRHIQGCYLDRDRLESRLRILARKTSIQLKRESAPEMF
jgi:gamma-butyrobetaine dioxygenase